MKQPHRTACSGIFHVYTSPGGEYYLGLTNITFDVISPTAQAVRGIIAEKPTHNFAIATPYPTDGLLSRVG